MLYVLGSIVHAILWVVSVGYLLPRVRKAPLGKAFVAALVYKVVMGWLLGGIFFFYYQQGDTINYFRDACQLAALAYDHPGEYLKVLVGQLPPPASLVFQGQPRALFFAKLVSIVNYFTYNNYWITSAYFSLLSFWCSWLLANFLCSWFPHHKQAAAIAFLFYPSVVFWGSGVLKESLAVAAITWIVYQGLSSQLGTYRKNTLWVTLPLGLAALWILWNVKYYYAAVLLPTLLSSSLAYRWGHHRSPAMPWIFAGSWLLLLAGVSLLHPRLGLDQLAETLVYNYRAIVRQSDSSNVIHFTELTGSLESLIKNIPLAIVSGLFRPIVSDSNTLLQWMAGLENTGLLLAAGSALVRVRNSKISSTNRLWIVAAVVYSVVLGTLLAFASPNFGSLMRYKVSFLPFLVYLCLVGNQKTIQWLAKNR